MKQKLIIITTLFAIIIMGIFSFLKKKNNLETSNDNQILLGMVLLEEANSMKIKSVVDELRTKWKLEVIDTETGDEASVLTVDNYKVAIGNMPVAIPGNEIGVAAEYNYYWENGKSEATAHKGHIIVSILNGGKNPIKENILFNKVVSSILNNSKSIGVYIGGRTLLLSKDFYQFNIDGMSETDLPINNLVYFGVRKENNKTSVYTFGLKDFGKLEMEILESTHSSDELMELLYNLTSYVLESNVTLKDGETIGMSADQKLKIKKSKGKYIEQETLKIDF